MAVAADGCRISDVVVSGGGRTSMCQDVDGRDSLWPWRQGWRDLPCCSGWR